MAMWGGSWLEAALHYMIYTMQYSLCVAVLKKAMAVLYMRCDMCTVGG